MILVTTGTMLPFDRLIESMDRWAAEHPTETVFAQIGEGSYVPLNMAWARMLGPEDFADKVAASQIIVAHAGTGSYFLAAEKGKALVIMPRLAANREHTTDHQVHTARWLSNKEGVYVAMSDEDLPDAIDKARQGVDSKEAQFSPYAPNQFLSQIRQFLLA